MTEKKHQLLRSSSHPRVTVLVCHSAPHLVQSDGLSSSRGMVGRPDRSKEEKPAVGLRSVMSVGIVHWRVPRV